MDAINIGRAKYSLRTVKSFPDGRLGEVDYKHRTDRKSVV